MSGVPYLFASASGTLPLSQLDTNFSTPVTIGTTPVALGNTVTTLAGLTLSNPTISTPNFTTNVGIGTSTPTSLLQIVGATDPVLTVTASSSGSAWLSLNGISSAVLHNPNNVPTVFTTNGTERMRISAAGNVGIGTSAPSYLLDVNGTGRFVGSLLVNGGTALSSVTNPANNPATGTPSSSTYLRGDGTWATFTTGTVTSITAGTGLSGGPITSSGTIQIANTGVAAATYGSASSVPVVAFNAQGQATSASNTAIAIDASAVTTGTLAVARGGTGVTSTSAISVTSTSGFTKTLANWTGSSVTPSTINFPSGSLSPNPLIQTAGTSGSPLTSPASVLVAALYSSYGPGASSASVQQGAIVGLAQLYGASTARNANVRAGFFETVDNAGNTGLGVSGNNFVEGVRGHGVPSAGANYTATEGGIFYGAGPAYPSQHMFVFGAEVQVDQQYANAPAPQNLNTQQISAGVNVSIGELASVVTTSASGTGTTATIGYANTSGSPLFPVGSSITVAGVTPSGYNATAVVTAATNNSASYTNATTGAQTVAGTIQQSYFKVDAAFLINPFNPVQAQSGLLIPAGTVTNSAVALGAGAGPTYGLNAGFATGMYAAVLVANNVPAVRAYNAAVTSQLNVLSVNTTNQLVLGNDITAGMIVSIRDETGANPIAREVQYGASNSGGAGFRSLVVPN